MSSSISHSKKISIKLTKKQLLVYVVALVVALSSSICYTLYLNPENVYFSEAKEFSDEWSQKLESQFSSKYVIFGGSSSRTGIDPKILLDDYNIPLVNAGLHAGFGVPVLTEMALNYAKPGDTLIMALEPAFMLRQNNGQSPEELPETAEGDRFLLLEKGFPYYGSFASLGIKKIPSLVVGLSAHNWTMVAKVLTGTPLYRYNKTDNLHKSGWMEVSEKRQLNPLSFKLRTLEPDLVVSEAAVAYLGKLHAWAQEHKVRLVCSIPRAYENPDYRYVMAVYALVVSDYMPVLKDECLASYPYEEKYADTGNHLNAAGAEKATRELGRELVARDYWTREELLSIIKEGQLRLKMEEVSPKNENWFP